MTLLPDIDVLVARVDTRHRHHEAVRAVFHGDPAPRVLLSPIVELGFLETIGNPEYPGGPGSLRGALELLRSIHSRYTVLFCRDDLALRTPAVFGDFAEVRPERAAAIYLLALAASRGAYFLTFKSDIDPSVIPNADRYLYVVD